MAVSYGKGHHGRSPEIGKEIIESEKSADTPLSRLITGATVAADLIFIRGSALS